MSSAGREHSAERKQGGLFTGVRDEIQSRTEPPYPLADLELPKAALVDLEIRLIKELLRARMLGEASKAAGMGEGKGRSMAFRLVEMGVLNARKFGVGSPWKFSKGPLAYPYERGVQEYFRNGRLGSPKLGGYPVLRVHRGAYSFRLTAPPARVAWETAWDPKGLGYATDHRLVVSGVNFWLKSIRGEPAVLSVEPPDAMVVDPALVVFAPKERLAQARGFAVQLLVKFGGSMDGASAALSSPIEYAVEVEGLDPFGRPGVDLIWADRSLGGNRVEVETQDVGLAAELLGWAYAPHERTLSQVVESVMSK